MKINHQENCEYRSSSIVIDLIDFHCSYQFFLFRFNISDKLNGQDVWAEQKLQLSASVL